MRESKKLPTIVHTRSGKMRKLWEAYDQAIFEVHGGYVLVPDHQGPWPTEQLVAFVSWDHAYYCLMGEQWQES
jgi:hypothetical protein